MKIKKTSFLAVLTLIGLLSACAPNNPSSSINSDTSSSSSESSDTSTSTTTEPDIELTGDGSKENPYLIQTAKHLFEISDKICDVENIAYVKLNNDIDLKGQEWTPYGTMETFANVHFDGNGHKISGLKISSSKSIEKEVFGLFGFVTGIIKNLTVSGDINIQTLNSDEAHAGLIAGYANNLYIENCHTEGQIILNDNKANTGTTTYAGGLVGSSLANESYYVDFIASSSNANVESYGDYIGSAGGILGASIFDFTNIGIFAIHSSYASGEKIVGSNIAGGVIGTASYYTSVVNSVVDITTIETTSSFMGTSWSGGIVASPYYENAYLFNIVDVDAIKASDSATDSYVGDICGNIQADGFEREMNILGSIEYGNIATNINLQGVNKNDIDTTEVANLKVDSLTNVGFDKGFNLKDGELPTLKSDYSFNNKGNVKIHANNGGEEVENIEINLGTFNQNVKTNATYENHLLIHTSYDKNNDYAFRWYAPLNADIELYNIWYDANNIAGWHLGLTEYNPQMYFGLDGSLTWLYYDHSSAKGTYWTNGEYVVFDIQNYENSVAALKDGKLTFPDVNDSSYIYEYHKASQEFGYYKASDEEYVLYLDGKGGGYVNDGFSLISVTYKNGENGNILLTVGDFDEVEATISNGVIEFTLIDPYEGYEYHKRLTAFDGVYDYSNKQFIGTYHGEKFDLIINSDGSLQNYKVGQENPYATGGYLAYGSTLEINVMGGISGTYKFNASKKVLLRNDGENLFSKDGTFVNKFYTEDKTLMIYQFSHENFIVKNGSLSTYLDLSGELIDGGEITVGDETYIINGNILNEKEPPVDVTPIVNTYVGTVGFNDNNVLVLNADYTGTYNDTPITFTFDGTNVVVTISDIGATLTLTFNKENQTLTGVYDDGEYTFDCEFSIKKEEATLLGSWEGNAVLSVKWVYEIKEGGIAILHVGSDSFEGTYTGDLKTKINISIPSFDYCPEVTLTLIDNQTADFEGEADYTPVYATFTKIS